ncbi:MAG: succinylglutamate-semialdehyde dehydrogenase [Pseudomonadota bacterium]
MTLTGDLFIDGTWKTGSGLSFSSTNPATGADIWQGRYATKDTLDESLNAASRALEGWRIKSVDDRFSVIERYSAIAADRKEEMAALITSETGKALWDARTEAGAIAGKAAVSLKAYHERTPTTHEDGKQLTHRPHGVMAVVGPFNFPGHLPNGHIIPALIAGNTVILKPSELTPAVAELMVRWWEEAGLPGGVLNLVHGGPEETQTLIQDPRTNGIAFTGGIRAGLAIHRALGGYPEKILALELGGNNPLVAWSVDDAEAAARIVARSAFITSGQRCTCARRLIVEDSTQGQRIIDAVAALIPQLKIGAPDADDQPFFGPLIHNRAASTALEQQSSMAAAGAKSIVAASALGHGPAYISAGLIDSTDWTARHDEELFAPFLQVIRKKTFEEAIDEANATRFGLAAGLLSDSGDHWTQFSRDIRAGIVNWNRQTTGAAGTAPFGGPGQSGNHRPAGYYAADYCAWPMASMVGEGPLTDDTKTPGIPS